MRIVYGGPEASTMGMTFVDAIEKVCDGGHLRVVAPYIAPDRLRELIKRSARFSIITDFTACYASLNGSERNKMTSLVAEHSDAFRHLPEVHAKVVFSQSKILVGSANLTGKGLEQRDELGALFHEATQLAEARAWFEALWARGRVVYAEDLREWVAKLPAYQPVALPPFGGAKATAKPAGKSTPQASRDNMDLDAILLLAPSKAILSQYLGIIRWAYEQLGVNADDPRLVVSIPETNRIQLSINNRWVLQHSDDYTTIRFLLTLKDTERFAANRNYMDDYQFSSRNSDRGQDPPCLVRIIGFEPLANERIGRAYLDAMRTELQKGRRAPNRKHHRPDLLELILDERKLDRHLRSIGME
jgi:hypothetical protein